MYLLLRADQRLKQNHEDVLLPARLHELYLSVKELGLILSQKIIRLSLTQCQEQLNTLLRHGDLLREENGAIEFWIPKNVFGTDLSTLNIGLMKCGRAKWQEAEATRKDFNIELIRQDKKFFTSEPFKVIQDAIPLVLHFRTMC